MWKIKLIITKFQVWDKEEYLIKPMTPLGSRQALYHTVSYKNSWRQRPFTEFIHGPCLPSWGFPPWVVSAFHGVYPPMRGVYSPWGCTHPSVVSVVHGVYSPMRGVCSPWGVPTHERCLQSMGYTHPCEVSAVHRLYPAMRGSLQFMGYIHPWVVSAVHGLYPAMRGVCSLWGISTYEWCLQSMAWRALSR